MSCCGYDLPESVLYYLLCVDFQDPSRIPDWQPQAILNAKQNASWLESCCLCQVNLETKVPKSQIPSILRGVSYQGGENGERRIQTQDYCEWDPKTNSFVSNQWAPGTWVGGYRNANGAFRFSCCWLWITNSLGRLSRFSYHFKFNPELTQGDILPFCNPCVCLPCLDPWCYIPQYLLVYKMTLTNENEWERISYLGDCCGKIDSKHTYQLKTIIKYPDGIPIKNGCSYQKIQPGYDEMTLHAPQRVMCMR